MKSLFRRLAALLIVIPAALFLLAGCGEKNESAKSASQNNYEPEENFTIKLR